MRQQGDIEQELARLADGTLAPERARELEARVAESPELRAMLAQQRVSLDAVALLDDRAPHDLRMRVEHLHRRPSRAMRARRTGIAGAIAAAVAAAAIAVFAILPGGAAGPTLAQASIFALKPATGPAPTHSFDGTLDLNMDGVPYPYWQSDYGWKAVGRRVDKIGGRNAVTVFYKKGDKRVGYTIVGGNPVSVKGSPAVTVRNGTRFRSVPIRGATVVTWERKNHSCILTGMGVPKQELLKLAAWKDEGELPWAGK